MAYNLRCRCCGHIYIAARDYYACPKAGCEANRPSLIGEVLETAVDVALVYTGVTAAVEVADVVGGLVGSIFNWD
jgi:hypothetical protein